MAKNNNNNNNKKYVNPGEEYLARRSTPLAEHPNYNSSPYALEYTTQNPNGTEQHTDLPGAPRTPAAPYAHMTAPKPPTKK